jgi:hypothetical protein
MPNASRTGKVEFGVPNAPLRISLVSHAVKVADLHEVVESHRPCRRFSSRPKVYHAEKQRTERKLRDFQRSKYKAMLEDDPDFKRW